MTREEAAELLEAFRRDDLVAPPIEARALSRAYVNVLEASPSRRQGSERTFDDHSTHRSRRCR